MKTNGEENYQRLKKTLGFPMRFFKEIGRSIRYIYIGLTLSMRKKISFDYGVMYLVVSLLTLVIFGFGYNIYEISKQSNETIDEVYNLALLREKGVFSTEELLTQIDYISKDKDIGIQVVMTSDYKETVPYTITSSLYDTDLYTRGFIEVIPRFLSDGLIQNYSRRYYQVDDHERIKYTISLISVFAQFSEKSTVLLILIGVSQFIGLVLISVVGSYRLKRVFKPVYMMTKTAENISINNMEAFIDVTKTKYELKDMAVTFNDMLSRIRTDYDKQKRFVSDVSHELRTPISIVNGYARMLERWGKEDEVILDEAIEAIKSESKNMQVLVENLLTLVRSDSQTLIFEKDSFYINELVTDIIKDMEMIDNRQHIFSMEVEPSIEVCLDYAKVKQTIRIFVDNAIKYTQKGGKITLKLKKEYDSVKISIEDTGIGISKEDLPFLFDRFYRADASRTRETGGHGLGLSIAKAMIIGQNGRIRVKSREHEGSKFIIILPLKNNI